MDLKALVQTLLQMSEVVLVPCWQGARLASLVVRASPAALASWARNKLGCWTFVVGKVGEPKGNRAYRKHNVCLSSCSVVHS